MIRTLFILAFFTSISSLKSQSLEFGFLAGASIYNGDLSPLPEDFVDYFEDVRPAGGIFLRGIVHPKLAVRGSLFFGGLAGKDNQEKSSRQLNFKSFLAELSVVGELHLFRNARNSSAPHFSPYLFGGGAVYFFNPKTEYQGELVELQPIGTEGQGLAEYPDKYSRVQFSIPVGVGLHLQINDRLSIGGEFGARKLFTDYIDDVSGQSVNYNTLVNRNGAIAGELSIRNPDLRPTEPTSRTYQRGSEFLDWYYIGGLTIAFKIQEGGGGQFGCPGF